MNGKSTKYTKYNVPYKNTNVQGWNNREREGDKNENNVLKRCSISKALHVPIFLCTFVGMSVVLLLLLFFFCRTKIQNRFYCHVWPYVIVKKSYTKAFIVLIMFIILAQLSFYTVCIIVSYDSIERQEK